MVYEYLLVKPTPGSVTTQALAKESHFRPGIARPSELDCLNWVKYPCSDVRRSVGIAEQSLHLTFILGLLETNNWIHWEASSIFYGLNCFELLIGAFTKRDGTHPETHPYRPRLRCSDVVKMFKFGLQMMQKCIIFIYDGAIVNENITMPSIMSEKHATELNRVLREGTHCRSRKLIFVTLVGMLIAAIKKKWVSTIRDSKRVSEFLASLLRELISWLG